MMQVLEDKQVVNIAHDFHEEVQQLSRRRVGAWFLHSDTTVALYGGQNGTKAITYGQLKQSLKSAPRLGIPNETRIALIVPAHESDLCALSLLCGMDQNCIVCPLDARLDTEAIASAASQLKCNVAIISRALKCYDAVEALFEQVFTVSRGQSESTAIAWQGRNGSNPFEDNNDAFEPSRTLLLLRTSGTTSTPKVVPLTALNLLHNARAIRESLRLDTSDIGLNIMPFFHIGGIACALLTVLCAGSSVICLPSFDPAEFLRRLQQEPRPTWYYAVPTVHKALLLHLRGTQPETGLRFIRSGAAHLPHQDAVALAAAFDCRVLQTYSMSECMPVASVPCTYDLSREGSVGPPIGPSVKVVSADNARNREPLPFGSVGELMVRGPGVTPGYLDCPGVAPGNLDGAVPAQREEWLATGDLATIDTDGWIYLKGRKKEMVKRGGEQVPLFEVDEAVLSHPHVDVAVAFGVANPLWGEEVAVAVVPGPGAPVSTPVPEGDSAEIIEGFKEEIMKHAGAKLDQDFKQPKQVLLLQSEDQLPKGPTRKILRSLIAETFHVCAVDVLAESQLKQVPTEIKDQVETHMSEEKVIRPSKTLYGVRFIVALFVVNLHVGAHPFKWWTKLQNFSMNMTVFTLLAGVLLAGSNSRYIPPSERLAFYVSRFAAAQPLLVFSVLLSLPAWFMRCYPGSPGCGDLVGSAVTDTGAEYALLLVGSLLLHTTGFHTLVGLGQGFFFLFNSVTWFNTSYYCLILLFPLVDGWIRTSTRSTAAFTAVFVFLFLLEMVVVPLIQGDVIRYLFVAWTSTFFIGVALWHLILLLGTADPDSPRYSKYKIPIAVSTDLASLALLGITVAALVLDCEEYFSSLTGVSYKGPLTCTFTTNITFEMWETTAQHRWSTYFGYLAHTRMFTPILALWIFGLAHGQGVTATFLSSRILTRTLSPLAYPLYLFQTAIATYYYFIVEGLEPKPFLAQQGGIPYPVPWYGVVVVVIVSLLIGLAFNRWINPRWIPFAQRYYDVFFRGVIKVATLGQMSLASSVPKQGIEGEKNVEEAVFQVIRNLSGAVVNSSTSLEEIGLDSFGASALVGSLRAKLPQLAHDLKPSDVRQLGTVENLVNYLVDMKV